MIKIDLETARAMRAQQVHMVRLRLRGEGGRAAFGAHLRAGWHAILDAKVVDVIEPAAVAAALEGILSDPVLGSALRPIARAAILLELARLREEPATLGAYVPQSAREALRELCERPGLLPERFVREVLTHRAFEEVMRDVLEGALTEFQEKANPLTAEWGLPSVLKKAGPFGLGLGALAGSLEGIRAEIDKKLEPQRKIFLQSFARKALGTMADFIVRRHDEPQFVALRKELLDWLLEQPVRELLSTVDQRAGELGERAAGETFSHVATWAETRRRRRAAISMAVAAHGRQTVREALSAYGVTLDELDWDAVTAAVWPIVDRAMHAPMVNDFIEDVVGEFWDTLDAEDD